ncbi:guanylate kinase [Candidatus Woesearchaeota archaeon]|nr:guanylate kinase [Candidatus Woesearchaeota archaeon]
MRKGKIFFFIGPSGAGKTVISEYILKNRKNTVPAISSTTREKRPNEINGKDMNFLTKEEFKEAIKLNKMVEYAEVFGNYYGTSIDSFNPIKKGKDVIKIIEIQGAKTIKKKEIKATYFFLCPINLETLKERLEKRKDKDIELRMSQVQEFLNFKKEVDYIINTDGKTEKDIERCALEIMKIMDNI